MSDGESRHGHLPKAGGEIFADNVSETVQNDQTGLPPWVWAVALTAQLQAAFAAQVAAQAQAQDNPLDSKSKNHHTSHKARDRRDLPALPQTTNRDSGKKTRRKRARNEGK